MELAVRAAARGGRLGRTEKEREREREREHAVEHVRLYPHPKMELVAVKTQNSK